MTYTAEEVREAAETNEHPIPLRVRYMLRDYAADLDRRAEGVTDEVVERACAAFMGEEKGDWADYSVFPGDMRKDMRAALLAVWPVAAEPAQPDESAVDRLSQYLKSQSGYRCLNDVARRDIARDFLAVVTPPAPAEPAQVKRFNKRRFEEAPCYLCGYNGPGYFQPGTHPCAAKYHASTTKPAEPAQPAHEPDCNLHMASVERRMAGCDCSQSHPAPSAQPADSGRAGDAELRQEWRDAGGSIHGPNVETVTMPEANYFAFRRALAAQGQGEPVAWSRTGTIHDDDGRPIGEDEIEVHWGSEAPDDGWSPLYDAPPASADVASLQSRLAAADALLQEAIGWNWLDDGAPRPDVMDVLDQRIQAHLSENAHG